MREGHYLDRKWATRFALMKSLIQIPLESRQPQTSLIRISLSVSNQFSKLLVSNFTVHDRRAVDTRNDERSPSTTLHGSNFG